MKLLLVITAAAGCASAGAPGDPGSNGPDAPVGPPEVDAAVPEPDAPPGPQPVTLQQTGDLTINKTAPTCSNGLGQVAPTGWYRVFTLADHQVTGVLHVTKVTFAVQSATGSPQLTVKLGTYTGPLDGATLTLGAITPLASLPYIPPNSGPAMLDVPIAVDVPAGSHLMVEIAQPATTTGGPRVAFGGTAASETRASYMRAAQCNGNDTTPRSLGDWGSADVRLLITVSGTK